MSNTPTESEFDKALRNILFNASGGVSDMAEKEIMAIKQAVDKQVDQLQTYKFTSSSEDKMVMLDDVKALYGGDKK